MVARLYARCTDFGAYLQKATDAASQLGKCPGAARLIALPPDKLFHYKVSHPSCSTDQQFSF